MSFLYKTACFIRDFYVGVGRYQRAPGDESISRVSAFISVPSIFRRFSRVVAEIEENFRVAATRNVFTFNYVRLFAAVPEAVVASVAVRAQVAFCTFVEIFIVVAVCFDSTVVGEMTVSIETCMFVFISLFLREALANVAVLKEERSVTEPTHVFVADNGPGPFLLGHVRIMGRLP